MKTDPSQEMPLNLFQVRLFGFYLRQGNTLQFIFLYQSMFSVNCLYFQRDSKEQKANNKRTIEYNGNNKKNRKIWIVFNLYQKMYQIMHSGLVLW